MKVMGYIRVSKDRNRDKLSPQIQTEQIKEYCKGNNHSLVDIIEDVDVKGGNFNRDGWKQLISRLGEVDGVVFISLDRLGRNLEESLKWGRHIQEGGKTILSVHENVDMGDLGGQIHYKTLLYIADIQNMIHAQKMKDVAKHKLDAGEWKGGPLPLGYVYDDDNNVVIEEDQAALVRLIYQLRVEGNGTRRIAFKLNDEGCTTKKGKRFEHGTVYSILHNYPYICKRKHNGEIYDLDIPRIIDDETWAKVRAMDGKRTRKSTTSDLIPICA